MLSPLEELESFHSKEVEATIPVKRTALETLQAVYRNVEMPLHTRMRAAALAIPYETPKLAVTAVVTSQDIAARLERAKLRADSVRLIPAAAKEIEAEKIAVKAAPRLAPDRLRRV